MLLAVAIREKEEQNEEEQARFEREMYVNNPTLYSEYMKSKEEEKASGNSNVTWIAPQSVEEARQLMDVFADIEKQIKEEPPVPAPDEDFVKQMSFIDLLGGINVDELGDE